MYCVSSVTWSTVDRPRRKPACSRGSCGSTTWSMRLCINLSRILNGTQSSEIGLYDLGVLRRFIWFWEGYDCSMAPGLGELRSSFERSRTGRGTVRSDHCEICRALLSPMRQLILLRPWSANCSHKKKY